MAMGTSLLAGLLGVVFLAVAASVFVASIVLLIVGRRRFPKGVKVLLIILLVISAIILVILALIAIFMGRAHPAAPPMPY
ncbi:MAG: hypothetical protein IK101_00135 [Oscillospiraceae bacterium]|nr:hypothetical protein [Oscillospiraceae bacterium]